MKQTLIFTLALSLFTACAESDASQTTISMEENKTSNATDTITLGAGCFWCVEAVFQDINGVISATSGYTGGQTKDPTYKDICTGLTGHAEVIKLVYDPSVVSLKEILEIFWQTHDPTTLNRQGADIGTQYRSAIFYHTESQKSEAEKYKKTLNDEGAFDSAIVTEISPAGVFYKAEDYHQEYYDLNGSQPYCQFVIKPKMEKLRKLFKEKLK